MINGDAFPESCTSPSPVNKGFYYGIGQGAPLATYNAQLFEHVFAAYTVGDATGTFNSAVFTAVQVGQQIRIVGTYPSINVVNYIDARITSAVVDAVGNYDISWESFGTLGSGSYTFSDVTTNNFSRNFVQVQPYGIKELASRAGFIFHLTEIIPYPLPTGSSVNTVISNTNTYKAGYTTRTFSGLEFRVMEDKYEINRPYVGVTMNLNYPITITTTVTTYDNSDPANPVASPVVTVTTSSVNCAYTITAADFDPTDPNYVNGGAAVYAGGVITTYPGPSYQDNVRNLNSSVSYLYSSYDENYSFYSGYGYLPDLTTTVVTSLGSNTGDISPADFYD